MSAEVAHVGVERFAPCDGEHDRTERHERSPWLTDKESDSVPRTEGLEDFGRPNDGRSTHGCECCEPDDHDRSEKFSNGRRTPELNKEQTNKNGERERHDKRFKAS